MLRLRDVRGAESALDLGAPGDSPGDTLFFDNTLRNRADTQTVGRFPSRCTPVSVSDYYCQGSLVFAHSQLELATTSDFGGASIVAAVVGGTGRYAGARGQARITPTRTPGTSRLVVHLRHR